jgi:hypothetical protein
MGNLLNLWIVLFEAGTFLVKSFHSTKTGAVTGLPPDFEDLSDITGGNLYRVNLPIFHYGATGVFQ